MPELTKYDKSLGPCPICGNRRWWINDIPLAGFCWGSDKKPHKEVKKVIEDNLQPHAYR